MAKRAFYREYRPHNLSEVMGQPHITQTLENSLKDGSISHAYLFSGPRGIGKTSVARIFAHEINGIPYEDDSTHLDIIEIDAASNRRIDEIRDLRDKIGIAPTSSKYKVYIIDEVHMLTKEAFNALLKTLEEPPEHAVFILATTEAHRLPDTILSRTQRHTFKPVTVNDLAKHMALIAKKEKIVIDDQALNLLAIHAAGSYRDALSLLDQLSTSHNKTIELEDARSSLGLAPQQLVSELLEAVADGNSKSLLELTESAFSQGISAPILAKQVVEFLQSQWMEGERYEAELLKLVDGLLGVQGSSEPEIKMTITLLEACLNSKVENEIIEPAQPVETKAVKKVTQPKTTPTVEAAKVTKSATELDGVVETRQFDQEAWERALSKIQNTNNSLYAVLRMARAGLNGNDDVVILTFQFPFHQKQVATAKNKKIVEDILGEEMGQPVALKMLINKDLEIAPVKTVETPSVPAVENHDGQISSVIDIMGGGEVVSI